MLSCLSPEGISPVLVGFFQGSLRSRIAGAEEGSKELGTATVLTDTHIPDLTCAGGPGGAGTGFLTLSKEGFG